MHKLLLIVLLTCSILHAGDDPSDTQQVVVSIFESKGKKYARYERNNFVYQFALDFLEKSAVLQASIKFPSSDAQENIKWLFKDLNDEDLRIAVHLLDNSNYSNAIYSINLDKVSTDQLFRLMEWSDMFSIDLIEQQLIEHLSKKPDLWENIPHEIHIKKFIHHLNKQYPISSLSSAQKIALIKLFNKVDHDHTLKQYYDKLIQDIALKVDLWREVAKAADEKSSKDITQNINLTDITDLLCRQINSSSQEFSSKRRRNHILDKDELSEEIKNKLFEKLAVYLTNAGRLLYPEHYVSAGKVAKIFGIQIIKINPIDNNEILVCFKDRNFERVKNILIFNRTTHHATHLVFQEGSPIKDLFYSSNGKKIIVKYFSSTCKTSIRMNVYDVEVADDGDNVLNKKGFKGKLSPDATMVYTKYDQDFCFLHKQPYHFLYNQKILYDDIKYNPDGKTLLSYDQRSICLYKVPTPETKSIVALKSISNPFDDQSIKKIKYNHNGSEFVVYNDHQYATFNAHTFEKKDEGQLVPSQHRTIRYDTNNQLLSLYYEKLSLNLANLSLLDYEILTRMSNAISARRHALPVNNFEFFKQLYTLNLIYRINPLLLINDPIAIFKKALLKQFIRQNLPKTIPTHAHYFTCEQLSKKSLTFLLPAMHHWQEGKQYPVDHTQCDLLFANNAPLTVLKELFDTQLLNCHLDLYADKITNGAHLGTWAKQPIINTLYGKNNNGLLFLIMAYQRSWKYRKPHVIDNQDAHIFFNLQRDIGKEPSLQKLYNNPHFFDVSAISPHTCISHILPPSLMKTEIMSSKIIQSVPMAIGKQPLIAS